MELGIQSPFTLASIHPVGSGYQESFLGCVPLFLKGVSACVIQCSIVLWLPCLTHNRKIPWFDSQAKLRKINSLFQSLSLSRPAVSEYSVSEMGGGLSHKN